MDDGMLSRIWTELSYYRDIYHITKGSHVKRLQDALVFNRCKLLNLLSL